MMTKDEIRKTRRDARMLEFIVAAIECLTERHPESMTLQMFDATPLRMVAYNLEDDADQEERIAEEYAAAGDVA